MTTKFLILLIAPLLALTACSQRKYQSQDDVLATVNARNITLDQFQEQIMPISGFQGVDTRSVSGKKKILDDMVLQELIFQDALSQNFHLENLAVKHAVIDQFLKKKFQAEVERITQQDVRSYYDQHIDSIDQVEASHILLTTNSDDEEAKQATREKIESILSEIKNGTITFEDAAKKYSQDKQNAREGGKLGYFHRSKMVPAFQKAAFAMQTIGEISGVVETNYGFHLIKLTGRKVGFEFHRERIRQYLIKQAVEEKTNLYKTALKSDSQTEVFYDRLPKEKSEN